MLAVLAAALLAAAAPQPASSPAPTPAIQTPAPPPQDPDGAPVRLEDVQVSGRTLDALIRGFVTEVAAPNRNRGIARWRDHICIGAANLRADVAQYLVDRVSTVAEDIGLQPGAPGCVANVLIIASDDPDALSQQLIDERPRAFRVGGSGIDLGGAALRIFAASDRPVRWWPLSMPVDSLTGERMTRIKGDCRNTCDTVLDYAPQVTVPGSRLTTQIVDNLFRTIIILDVDQVSRVSVVQLADYIAMITLAQIDPAADTMPYASILNVFEESDTVEGLTDWDLAYLHGLYDAQRTRQNLRAGRSEIASSIRRAHDTAGTAEDDAADDTE